MTFNTGGFMYRLRSILITGVLALTCVMAPASVTLQQILPSDTMVQTRDKLNSNFSTLATSSVATAWGTITGSVVNQTDLTNYIWSAGFLTNESLWIAESNLYYKASNPSGYLTAGSNVSSLANDNSYSSTTNNNTFTLTNSFADLIGNRSVWGPGLSPTNMTAGAYGSVQRGQNSGYQYNAGVGCEQAGSMDSSTSTQAMYSPCVGSIQLGRSASSSVGPAMIMTNGCYASMQLINMQQSLALAWMNSSRACLQMGNLGAQAQMYINQAGGVLQLGATGAGTVLTNDSGHGSIQMGYGTYSTNVMTGRGSIGIGGDIACTNDNAIVVGNIAQVSHGDGSISASGGFWDNGLRCLTSTTVPVQYVTTNMLYNMTTNLTYNGTNAITFFNGTNVNVILMP